MRNAAVNKMVTFPGSTFDFRARGVRSTLGVGEGRSTSFYINGDVPLFEVLFSRASRLFHCNMVIYIKENKTCGFFRLLGDTEESSLPLLFLGAAG